MRRLILLTTIGIILGTSVLAQAVIPDTQASLGLRTGVSILSGDGTELSDPGVSAAFSFGYNFTRNLSFQFSAGYLTVKGDVHGRPYETKMIPLEISQMASLWPDGPVNPYLSAGIGAPYWWPSEQGSDTGKWDSIFTGRVGLQIPVSAKVCLDVGFKGSQYLTDGLDDVWSGSDNDFTSEGFIGLVYFIGAERDADGDGIPDRVDADPLRPEDFDGFQDEDGIPEYDNDGDGIPDDRDKAPNEPEDFDGFQDWDGVPDPDNDGDGIPDVRDKAPNDPEDLDGFQDQDGVPDPDNDGDGIPDDRDKCPDEPETFNDYQDEDGCPDEKPKPPEIKKKEKIILKGVNFESGSAKLTTGSYAVLDKVAKSLLAYPDIEIEIQGHTDSIGSRAINKRLSQKRAEAVVSYLVGRGVSPKRMRAVGYGEENPVADNKTIEGRAQNRRVEILRTK